MKYFEFGQGYELINYGDSNNSNYLINCDNKHFLKKAERDLEGKIKLIYIDPPYNTGNNFEHYSDEFDNSEWLDSLSERIKKLHLFLRDDGSIWISIDDRNVHHLRRICDQIFGEKNFINSIIWQKKLSPSNDSNYFSDSHDYVLLYAKNKSKWKCNLLPRTNRANDRYINRDNDSRGAWMSSDLSVKTPSVKNIYTITTPSGRKVKPPKSRSWSVSKSKFKELVDDNRIWFGENGDNVPRLKRFLSDVQAGMVPKTLWLKDEVGDNYEAKRETKKINTDKVFATPKPERLLERIIHIGSSEGEYVLDAYAGSGTTGSVAHKMGRKWIMIEINGVCKSHCLKRMEKVVEGSDNIGISNKLNWKGGGGFKFIQPKK